MSSLSIPLLLTMFYFLLLRPPYCSSSNILVAPVNGSHWINMKVILEQLHSRGHNITVLRSAKSWYIPSHSSIYTSLNISKLEDEADINYYNKILQDVMGCCSYLTFICTFCQQHLITSLLVKGHEILARAIATVLEDPVFIKKLQDTKFGLMLSDHCRTIGVILGSYLKLTMVFNVRWINTGEGHFTIAPSPISHIPVPGSELDDQMDFLERTKNMLHYFQSVIEQHFIINPAYSDLLQQHFPPGTHLLSLERVADIWLFRADFAFEFPRPTMPNVVYIGGLSQPLPVELETFVESSGEHGVGVVSLGTQISVLPREVTEAIAAAFAELPQKVIWRFVGEKLLSLGNNTLVLEWLPQNDLLGHPKTRAFAAHGGTSGIYEAIYHSVPVVGLPLLFDQSDNILWLKVRGAARVLEACSLTKEDFLNALKDVLENLSYHNNSCTVTSQ